MSSQQNELPRIQTEKFDGLPNIYTRISIFGADQCCV